MEHERLTVPQPLYQDVNVLRIGDTMVDTGHVATISRETLTDALTGPLAGVDRVLHTHPHIDHVGGSQTLETIADLPHVVPAGQSDLLFRYTDYLQRARREMTRLLAGFDPDESMWDAYFPLGDYHETRINVVRELDDGETIEMGDRAFEAISTPGHASPHLAFWNPDTRTVLSGDLVDHAGRFQYGPLLADIGDYKRSLARLRELNPTTLIPMHGPPMQDPTARLEASLSHVAEIEDRIQSYREHSNPCFARDFVTDALGIDRAQTPFLTLVIYEYLRHLEDRSLVRVEVTDEGIRIE